ncbi:MAG: glycosyl transferase family 2 [Clostridiales bacterium]|nr:glycosyl transferase family 2 [Clostridiales bacterium]
MDKKKISLIIPVYNEEKQISESIKVIGEIIDKINIDYEFILIDDGSSDNTWKVLKELSVKILQIKAFRLSRNFGKEAALCAGLECATGDACIVMDADLQHPPEIIPEMIRLWREEGYDVVEGVKASRGKENLINRLGAIWFYKLLKKLSRFDLDSASDFKLMDSKVVDAWKTMGERNTFFRGMSYWVGFNRISIPFIVAERTIGQTKWSVFRLYKLAVNAITSFSSLPLQFVTFLGMAFLAGSFLLGIQTLFMKFKGIAVSGFTTVILLLLIIGSSLMISLGIIGTYIAKIFDEVKGRPRYLISEKIDQSN